MVMDLSRVHIQGAIGRVIYTLGRFEITSPIIPELYDTKVLSPINCVVAVVLLFLKIHLILSVSVFSNNSSLFTNHASESGSPLFTSTL